MTRGQGLPDQQGEIIHDLRANETLGKDEQNWELALLIKKRWDSIGGNESTEALKACKVIVLMMVMAFC